MERYFVIRGTQERPIPQHIDAVMQAEDGSLFGMFSHKTQAELEQEYGAPMVILGTEELKREHDDALRTEPVEITEEQFNYALEVLPPMRWGSWLGVESFRMREFYSGNMTNIYAKLGGKFWTFCDDAYMRGEDIAHKVKAAMDKTQH